MRLSASLQQLARCEEQYLSMEFVEQRFLRASFGSSNLERRMDGAAAELESCLRSIRTRLAQTEPASLPQLGDYRRMISLAVVGWIFGLLGIVAWMVRHRLRTLRQDVEHIEAGRSVVERLRPLLEYAREGAISNRQQAELERLILSFWRQRLGLEGVSAIEAMSMLRSHEEAGQLLVKLEHWLHRPDTGERESIDSLLRPYEEMLSRSD